MIKLKKQIFFFLIALCLLLLFNTTLYANVTVNVLHRVLFIKYNKKAGTGFTIEVDNKQYIITAKHIVEGIKQNDSIFVFHDCQWRKIEVRNIKFKNPEIDAIILIPPFQITPITNVEFTIDDLSLDQDVYFLGFPFGLKTEVGNLNNNFPIPFVKKGICSSIDNTSPDTTGIWIDGYSNPGFSGGPIVFRDTSTGNFKIAGILEGHLPEPINVIYGEEETKLYVKSNSGLIYGIGINDIIRIIKEEQANLISN